MTVYEGEPVLSLIVSSFHWQCAVSVLIITEFSRGRRQRRRPGAEFGGESGRRKKFSQTKISELRFGGKEITFSRQKILMTFFSHLPDLSDFDSLFSDSPYLYCVKCRI